MMDGVLIHLPLLYYQKTTIRAVNRSLASTINKWNDFSKCCYKLVMSYKHCCTQYDLLTWVINMVWDKNY